MRRGPSVIATRLAGSLLIGGSLALTYFSFFPPVLPWSQGLHIVLAASAFGEMNPSAGVELGGVRVGSVDSVDYVDRTARLHVTVDPRYAGMLHPDLTAQIKPHGLLGPKYVELTAGSTGSVRDGTLIPEAHVHVTTDFDQVLNTFQPDVRLSMQVIFDELGNAGNGRGEDVNQALASLGTASTDLRTTVDLLQRHEPDLDRFIVASETLNRDVQHAPNGQNIHDTAVVLNGLAQVEDSIGASIDNTATFVEQLDVVMSGNQQNLADALMLLPGTTTRLTHFLDLVSHLVTGVRPSLPNLLTAVMEGKSVTAGRDANGHFVRVLALSGLCSGAPDPAGTCSTPVPPNPASTRAATVSPSSNGTSAPASVLSDQELMALFLGA